MATESIASHKPEYEIAEAQGIPEWILNEALLINDAVRKGTLTKERAQAGSHETGAIFEDKDVLAIMRDLVEPRYYVEYPRENLGGGSRGEALLDLFQSEFDDRRGRHWRLAEYLAQNKQGLSIAMSTLDGSTAEALSCLNENGVLVVAWVVVDDADGYWTNKTNIRETIFKTDAILDWSGKHGVKLQALGFDSEKPLGLVAGIGNASIAEIATSIAEYRRKTRGAAARGDSQTKFNAFIERLQRENIRTEIYAYPRGLKGLLGGIDANVPGNDRVVEMIYLSGLPAWAIGPAYGLARSFGSIPAFGIVSGKPEETPGRDFGRITEARRRGRALLEVPKGPLPRHLSFEELVRSISAWLDQEIDLKQRAFRTREVYLFALNHPRVVLMLSDAVDEAFNRQQKKWERG